MIRLNRSYDDIIHLPRPVSPRRNPMPALARAAQFAPFAALSGFEDSIDETARLTDRPPEHTEDGLRSLNEQLRALMDTLASRPVVTLTCFEPDPQKPGGAYRSITGAVRRIDEIQQELILADGRVIPFKRIHEIGQEMTGTQSAG